MKQISCICEQRPNRILRSKTHAAEITVRSGDCF